MYYLSISTQDYHEICSTMENPLVFYEREEEGIPLFVKFFGGLLGHIIKKTGIILLCSRIDFIGLI